MKSPFRLLFFIFVAIILVGIVPRLLQAQRCCKELPSPPAPLTNCLAHDPLTCSSIPPTSGTHWASVICMDTPGCPGYTPAPGAPPVEAQCCEQVGSGGTQISCATLTDAPCQPPGGAPIGNAYRAVTCSSTPGCPGSAGNTTAPQQPEFTPSLPRLQVAIPTLQPFTSPFRAPTKEITPGGKSVIVIDFIGRYISGLYAYLVGIAGFVAGFMYVWAGVLWLTAGGGAERIGEAKKKIASATVGLVLLLSSYVILKIVNPDLVFFKPLRVEYVEREVLTLREGDDTAGGGLRNLLGEVGTADATQCNDLSSTPGKQFTAAFTSYYSIAASQWGQGGEYTGVYKGSNPDLQGKGDFFCSVSMECGCPNGQKLTERTCDNGRKQWPPCAYFDQRTQFCGDAQRHIPGGSVAASTCFPKGCIINVNGHDLKVTDRGAGIIGTHFDLYLGTKGGSDFVNDTGWVQPSAKMVSCPTANLTEKELNRMRSAYARYKPGVCRPGYNC